MAFWDYTEGTMLTIPCDADVKEHCPNPMRRQGAFSIGVVARCLSKQLASSLPLNPGCRQLVFIAAPKDVRLYLQVWLALCLSAHTRNLICGPGWAADVITCSQACRKP